MLFAQIEQWTMFAGISLMLVILLRRYWRYYGKVKRQNLRQERKQLARPASRLKRDGVPQSPLADAPPEALRWQVEMHDTARDLKAELDSKIGVLQTLVRMADDRIAALAVATERHRAATAEHSAHDRHDNVGSGNTDSNLGDSVPPAVSSNALPSQSSMARPGNVTTATSTVGSSLVVGESGQLGSESLRRSIFELAERGWDASSIAREIERPIGDVEIILSLRST